MSEAMEKVLQNIELVELILEYAASGIAWKEARNLRLVCKSWCVASFKGLCSSTYLPKVVFRPHWRHGGENEIDPEIVKQIYPCEALVPIRVDVLGVYHTGIYDFISQFAPVIAQLNLLMPHETITDQIDYSLNFELTKLRQLTVVREWGPDYSLQAVQPFEDILSKIVQNAHILSLFKFENGENGVILNKFFKKLTHLEITTASIPHLEALALNTAPNRLISLKIFIDGEDDIKKFQRFADQIFPNLQELHTMGRVSQHVVFSRVYKLKHFSTELKISMEDGNSLCDNKALHTLELRLSQNGLQDFDIFATPESVYQNLTKVVLHGFSGCDLDPWHITSTMAMDNNLVQSFEHNGLPACPSLKSVNLHGFSNEVLLAIMPKLFYKWTTIKFLYIALRQHHLITDEIYSNLITLLTGLRRNQIPYNEEDWNDCLQDNANSITHLSSLECLSIHADCRQKIYILDRFLFQAAFLRIETLQSIELHGGRIKVDREAIDKWKAEGRHISGQFL